MSVDSFQDQAITCNLGQSAFGASLFLVFAPSHLFVPEKVSVTVAAITVALIGGAYVGFGATAKSLETFGIELGAAVLFATAALAGMLWNPLSLPLGLAAHAVWDLLRHNGVFGAPVPRWYIPLCVVFDLLAAAVLLVLYLA